MIWAFRAIWTACEGMKVEGGPEMTIRLQERAVTSLQSLDIEEGPYDGIIAAAGAANGLIKEVGTAMQTGLPATRELGQTSLDPDLKH